MAPEGAADSRQFGASTRKQSPPFKSSPRRQSIRIAALTAASAEAQTMRSISWPSCKSTTTSVLSRSMRPGMASPVDAYAQVVQRVRHVASDGSDAVDLMQQRANCATCDPEIAALLCGVGG
jgi:hypothetical protein